MSTKTQLLAASSEIPAHPRPEAAYFDHRFRVPEGTAQLNLRVSYYRATAEYDILLVVLDPNGHRGTFSLNATSEGPKGDVELSVWVGGGETSLTQVPGEVPAGDWLAQVWAAHVNRPLSYSLHVDALDAVAAPSEYAKEPTAPSLTQVRQRGPAWYKGELHTHTTFSDGVLNPDGLLGEARAAGVEFMAITDHNTVGAWPALARVSDICILPGLEITMPDGHCNLFGLQRWVDWRVDYRERTMAEAMQDARAQGAVVSINHPFAPGYSWHYDTLVELADCVEIVNYPSWWPAATEYNPMGMGLWTSMLNAGHRLTAVGGSDVFHLPPGAIYKTSPHPEAIVSPATWVFAQDNSPLSIMEGLRRGNAYVSMGPRVQLEARVDDKKYRVGEHIRPGSGPLHFDVVLGDLPAGARLIFTKNGRPLVEEHPHAADASYRFVDVPDWQERNWYRVDIFNQAGEVWAVTNPIYVGTPPSRPRETWGQALARARREGMIIEQTIFE